MINYTDIKIPCAGSHELTGTIFIPEFLKGAIIIAPATGIKRQFYQSFASFLSYNGYGVITYDNDGIGESRSGNLKQSKADLISWGQKDMTHVFGKLKTHFPYTSYHVVGHSAGGQLLGLMKGATELTSIFNFACSSGSLKNMKYPFKLTAHFFMNFFIPANNLLLGFTNSKWMGMGEPLPKKVAQQWADWCNKTGYIKNYLDANSIPHYYYDLKCPAMWINATDDEIANNKNVDDMLRVYPNLKVEKLTLKPADYALKEIGHMKFFSKQNQRLWKIAVDWFNQH